MDGLGRIVWAGVSFDQLRALNPSMSSDDARIVYQDLTKIIDDAVKDMNEKKSS